MNTQDLQAFSHFGHALWADPDYSDFVAHEALSATALLDLTPERTIDRASRALLERAEREGPGANQIAFNNPFYRLMPEERFALTAAHIGHWNYERIGRIINLNAVQVGSFLWSARLHLASEETGNPNLQEQRLLPHPTGSRINGTTCPDYDAQNPWTQRFLDDEMSTRLRLFLRNHLMACSSCQESLSRCRDLYYAVEAMIPDFQPEVGKNLRSYRNIWQKTQQLAHEPMTFWASLRVFSRRTDVRILLGLVAALILHQLII